MKNYEKPICKSMESFEELDPNMCNFDGSGNSYVSTSVDIATAAWVVVFNAGIVVVEGAGVVEVAVGVVALIFG